MDKTIGNIMKKTHIVIKEDNLEEYILKNFKEDAFVEISYNRVLFPEKYCILMMMLPLPFN